MKSTIFVGAAEPAPGPDAPHARGLYRRTPDSARWQRLAGGLPDDLQVNCIAVGSDDLRTLYIGGQRGLYRSTDGGDSWTDLCLAVDGMAVYSILLHPRDPNTIYAGLDHTAIFKSQDGGASWRRLPTVQPAGAITGCFPVRVLRMALDPASPDEIYAALEVGGIIRSLDGGESWQDMSQELIDMAAEPHLKSQILSDDDTEGMMDLHALTISPAQPGTVWIANRMGLFVSGDRGAHWREFGIARFSKLTYGRDLFVSPHDPKTFYAALSTSSRGDAGSLYRSRDLGENWERVDHDISIDSTLMTVGISRRDPQRIYCAARLGQVFGTEDGGASWNALPLPPGVVDVRAVACS